MYEWLLFHVAKIIQWRPLPKDKLTYYTEEEKQQHQELHWPSFENSWLAGFRANSNLIISKNQLPSHPIRAGLMQKNGSYLSPFYLLNSNTHFWFPCHLNKESTTLMERNFTEKAMWACLVIAPANQGRFDCCLLKGGIMDV